MFQSNYFDISTGGWFRLHFTYVSLKSISFYFNNDLQVNDVIVAYLRDTAAWIWVNIGS